MTTVFKALVAAAGLVALPVGATVAADATPCQAADPDEPTGPAKARLFERSADPSGDRTPAIARATGRLAMKALSAPVQFARWIKARSADRDGAD